MFAVYLWLPELAQKIVFNGVGLSGSAAVVLGVRLHRPRRPAPWYLLSAGLLAWVLGDMAYSAYDLLLEQAPFPSVADALYLSGYPLLITAVGLLVRRSGRRDAAAWQDACIWTVAALLLAFDGLIEPNLVSNDDWVARAVAVAYPTGDLLMLLLVLRLVTGRGRNVGVFGALAGAMGLYVLTDAVYGVQVLAGTYDQGSWVGLGYIAAPVIVGVTALHPRMVELTEPGSTTSRMGSRARFVAITGAALIAPALLAYQATWGQDVDALPIAVAGAVVLVLSTMRGLGLLSELEHTAVELHARERELQLKATSDPLTGLANRAALLEHLDGALSREHHHVVALLDLDGFKRVNDTLGHEVGDSLLCAVGRRLSAMAEPGELVARLGGDEFAVVSRTSPQALGTRVLAALEGAAVLDGSTLRVQASVGLARSDRDGRGVSELLRCADVAMYVAKTAGGRRCVEYRPEMSADLLSRQALDSRLTRAVKREEFVPHFQPVVDLTSHRLLGFEALARWAPEGERLRSPAHWLPAVERNGLVTTIDLSILRQATRQLVAWAGLAPAAGGLLLAVNASGHTLQEPEVAERILQTLDEEGFSPSRLILEVTESVLIDDEAVGSRLQRLRAAGVRVALDDFGTGWSSLAYLQRFPVDMLKLDRSFVAGLGSGGTGDAVPAAVMHLAASLNLDVVAEGVETPEQAAALRVLGCRQAQGYLLGRPRAAADLTSVVERGRVDGEAVLTVPPSGRRPDTAS